MENAVTDKIIKWAETRAKIEIISDIAIETDLEALSQIVGAGRRVMENNPGKHKLAVAQTVEALLDYVKAVHAANDKIRKEENGDD